MSDVNDRNGNGFRDLASTMFQQVKAIILNFVEPFFPRKRVRDCSEDSDRNEIDPVSPKRICLQDITMSENNLPSPVPKALPKQYTPTQSPKRKFRAPAHCRSPPKVKPINLTSESNNDVQIIEEVKKQTPVKNRTPSQNNRSFGLLNRRSELSRSAPSISIDLTSNKSCLSSKMYTRLSKEQYSALLGTFMNGKVNMEDSRIPLVPKIDLTKNETNNLARSLTRVNLSGIQRGSIKDDFIDLTKPEPKKDVKTIKIQPVVSLVDDDKVEEVRPVQTLNTLEKKLKQVPCTSPTWLNDFNTRYRNKLIALNAEKGNLQKKVDMWYQRNQEYLAQWHVNRIKMEDAFIDYIIPIKEEIALPELTPDMKTKVKAALRPNPADELLVNGFGISIKRRDISTFRGLNWLNDEVINFYMNLLMDRAKGNSKLPTVYAFNTFFYPKLVNQGHSSLRRWTRKVDIFSHDLLVVPVHLQMHWCMSVVDFKQKTIKYYDSMGHPNNTCLKAILNYLVDEHKDKKNEEYNTSGWSLENVKGLPQQNNGSDCGVFACTFAEYVCRRAPFTFSQKDMPYFREKMVYEIISSSLMT